MEKEEESLTVPEKKEQKNLTRREVLKLSGVGISGLALAGALSSCDTHSASATTSSGDECSTECICQEAESCDWSNVDASQRYSYFETLGSFYPFSEKTDSTIAPLGENEMRITFMGSSVPPNLRRKQQMMSVFVEVGWNYERQMPLDQFVFDCGSGVCTNYSAMNVGLGRMDKVFLNHLHGDHMSDLTHIYCFGPSTDRWSPLYVWGPGPSGVESPKGSNKYYDDGTRAFCEHLREACRWHTESFGFQKTSYTPNEIDSRSLKEKWGLPYDPVPVGDDADNDSYAMIPIELDWMAGLTDGTANIAYDNKDTGVRISYFPVIHARQGSLGYKLEWNGLSMIYTSDTKPENLSIERAINGGNGVDVFIHEMAVPAQVWATKIAHSKELLPFDTNMVKQTTMVQNSSHTPPGAFGYLLSQITPPPRLTIATHFPVADDTIACAMKSLNQHCNVVQGNDTLSGEDTYRITWSFDLMVITVSKDSIREQQGVVSDFEFSATIQSAPGTLNTAKYHDDENNGDPYAQIDETTAVEPCNCETGACNYRTDGY